MQMNFDALAAALAELDFTEENEQIAALHAQEVEVTAAIVRAEERRRQISQNLADYDKPDGKAVAARLLEGEDATTAATVGQSRDALFAERQALSEAIRELNWQGQDLRESIRMVCDKATARTAAVAAPYAAGLIEEAQKVLAGVPGIYAGLVALTQATGVHEAATRPLEAILEHMHGNGAVFPHMNSIPVPSDLVTALNQLAHKGPALRNARFFSTVGAPREAVSPGFLGLAAAR